MEAAEPLLQGVTLHRHSPPSRRLPMRTPSITGSPSQSSDWSERCRTRAGEAQPAAKNKSSGCMGDSRIIRFDTAEEIHLETERLPQGRLCTRTQCIRIVLNDFL